jgi:thioredoxin 1
LKLKTGTLVIGILIVIGIVVILIGSPSDQGRKDSAPELTIKGTQSDVQDEVTKKLPTLVDLGKGTCIPCKKMKPILDELKIEYQGKAIVEVIDLRYDRGAALRYRIRLIPTQIFFDADGNEVYRHEGFMDKESIKMKFAEMGVH